MILLAVDTTSETGSLALARDGETLEAVSLPGERHSSALHAALIVLLQRHGMETAQLDAYGVTTGPGSFTGVRMGLAAVKGLAEVHGKPVAAVSTLETVAAAAWQRAVAQKAGAESRPGALAPLLDARRGQIFGAVYAEQEGGLRLLVEETVCSLASFLERLREAALPPLTFCGTHLEPYAAAIREAGCKDAALLSVGPQLAVPLARVAFRRWQSGRIAGAAEVDANYVRASDAELFWRE